MKNGVFSTTRLMLCFFASIFVSLLFAIHANAASRSVQFSGFVAANVNQTVLLGTDELTVMGDTAAAPLALRNTTASKMDIRLIVLAHQGGKNRTINERFQFSLKPGEYKTARVAFLLEANPVQHRNLCFSKRAGSGAWGKYTCKEILVTRIDLLK